MLHPHDCCTCRPPPETKRQVIPHSGRSFAQRRGSVQWTPEYGIRLQKHTGAIPAQNFTSSFQSWAAVETPLLTSPDDLSHTSTGTPETLHTQWTALALAHHSKSPNPSTQRPSAAPLRPQSPGMLVPTPWSHETLRLSSIQLLNTVAQHRLGHPPSQG